MSLSGVVQATQSFAGDRGAPETRNVNVVLQETLEKLKAVAPKKLKELRDECQAGLERLESASKGGGGGVSAEEFFKALKLGCAAQGCPKVVCTALEYINKQIEWGFLTCRGPEASKDGKQRSFIDTVIETVCACQEQADESVQFQVIRVLLTAITSQSCEVHGESLMLAVRTCFQIHKDSKFNANQRTAQASLTQMLNVVIQRMELSSAGMSRRSASFDAEGGDLTKRQPVKITPSDLALQPPEQLLNDWMASYLTRIVDGVVLKRIEDGQPLEKVTSEATPPGKFGWCVICRNTADHYCIDTKDPVCSHPCKFRNLERIALVEAAYGVHQHDNVQVAEAGADVPVGSTEAGDSMSEMTGPSSTMPETGTTRSMSMLSGSFAVDADAASTCSTGDDKALNPHHKDALMVFSSLCRLSMKDLPPGQADQRQVRSKKLSLELIYSMLQNCGPVFRSSDLFINDLKSLLCHSLIKNCVSSIPKIFNLSLRIFVMLITSFKDHLKTEIGVFIEQVFLRILESGNSTFLHKSQVLQVFYKLCTDATTALELFLNFDCDVDEKNIFERMIDCLSKIAQGKYTSSEHANLIGPEQERDLRMLSLQAIVTLMGSIVDWARRMTEDQRPVELEDGPELRTVEPKGDVDSEPEDETKSEATFTTSATGSTSVPSSIVEQKQRKLELQMGVNKFNMKPKRGIEYLKQMGFVSDDPQAIADLFKNSEIGLDKTQIGDYLGEDKPFNKAVLYRLVDDQDFRSLELDAALRLFLSIFRLPGEAQKIDRMMEKFAEKYCCDNPGKFANADCAFVLSFSLIMLQTDLHNPGIKNKMTCDAFVRNNRGINDNGDLPREYLEGLYNSVLTNPIRLKEDEDARTRLESQAALPSQKFELFARETESIVQKSQELMKKKIDGKKSSQYVAAHNVEHVRPLFEVACWPMLATLAVLLEMQDQQASVDLCIEGFKHCIRIAARFDMDTERDAFVSSLAKFTYLTTLKEMKKKNIECIKALLAIGLSEGNNLGPSWQYVLHCISQLERLHLIGARARQDFQFFQGGEEEMSPGQAQRSASTTGNQVNKRRAYGTGVSALMSISQDDRQVELANSESVVSQIDGAQIDLLFNRSASLSSYAIVHFVSQLARVSKEELALPDQPRIFSLQKLVEVADYNMNRIRLVWSRIWRVLSAHFVEVASHPNRHICMYAIDSLRQLANKFLEKDELSNYNFQAEFLKPFEVVMLSTHGVSREVKDLVMATIHQMVQMRIQNIKSGWKTVFHILHAAAQDPANEALTQQAFSVMQKVLERQYYHLFVENFGDGIRTLLAFGQCKTNMEISKSSVDYLLQAAEYLADQDKPDPPAPVAKDAASPSAAAGGGSPSPAPATADAGTIVASSGVTTTTTSHPAAHWFPILRGLSMLVSDRRKDVRAAALEGVFKCLDDYGSTVFDKEAWRMVFKGVIKPLFDDIIHQLQGGDQRSDGGAPDRSEGTAASWGAAAMGPPTCLAALKALVDLFSKHLDSLAFLLDDVLSIIGDCITHQSEDSKNSEPVARIGVEGFKILLRSTGKSLTQECWTQVTSNIRQLFNESMPTQLLQFEEHQDELPFSKDAVVTRCIVQLLLIDMLQDTVTKHYDNIPLPGVMVLVDGLQQSFEFAKEFNQQLELRQALKRLGFMREMKQLPGLLKQEREALSCSLKILFQVQSDARMQQPEFISYAPEAMDRLMKYCSMVLQNYVQKEQLLQEHTESLAAADEARDSNTVEIEMHREVLGLAPIISEVVLRGLKDLEAKVFQQYAVELFPLLAELTAVSSREVRLMVRDILLEQVRPLLQQP